MRKAMLWRATAALLATIATSPAFAQVSTGAIRVVVVDADGAALPGTTCNAETVDSVVKRSGTTGENGEVILPSLNPSDKYVVTCELSSFNGSRNENVLVSTGQTTTVRVGLQLASVTEEVTVVAETPLVDVTSAIVGQEITLQLTEALPTGRSYQSYLQLVPGVAPVPPDQVSGGNPAARSGINYADIGGVVGTSSDNFYYIEGINVTDGVTGTFGANLNTEIIQEQKVLTGGIPAEFVGAPGLVSSVITKSGSANFAGSVRYDREDDSLVSESDNPGVAELVERDDMALTFSGPFVRGDRAWFFGSYRDIDRTDDVSQLDTGAFLRSIERNDEQGFFKLSWAITDSMNVSGTYLDDPTEISGSNNPAILNNRDRAQEQGGERYILNYTGIFGPAVVSLSGGKHNGEVSSFAANRTSLNTVVFRRTDGSTLNQQQLGGAGSDLINERDTEFWKGDLEWYFSTGAGDHNLKAGIDFQEHINFRDTVFTGPQFRASLNPGLSGISAAELNALGSTGQLTGINFNVNNTSDFAGFMNTVNASANRTSFYNAFDTNHDGTITQAELGAALHYNSSVGNPNGMINYDRIAQVTGGAQETSSEGTSLYLQDSFRLSNWTFNVGVRAEKWEHIATTGDEIFTFDWEYAPRLSAAWDINGNGKQKVSAYYGRYYDPIRNNLTNFAGTLSGSILHEQVFANNEWVTYRVRGGPVVLDATFAPTTKTPYTDEILATYQRDLGANMAIEFSVFHRETQDIIEDYDLCLYAGECYTGDPNAPGALFLGPGYFGYTEIPQGINFFIATLEGGERTLDGAEVVFRKRLSNNWQSLFSYTYSDAEGNTNSDSNADFAGDVLFLDPRAPNVEGRQPGSIEHLVKLAGSYHFDFGLVLGGQYRWNSGAYQNRTFLAFGRHLPVGGGPENFVFNGAVDTFAGWAEPGTVGGVKNPSYGVLDLSASYHRDFGPVGSEFFLSVFNATDDQDAVFVQDLSAGQGTSAFGDPTVFVAPRSISLGVRLSFGR